MLSNLETFSGETGCFPETLKVFRNPGDSLLFWDTPGHGGKYDNF